LGVIRNYVFGAIAALALAGCATLPPEPIPQSPLPPPALAPPAASQPYINAPRAPLLSELVVCSAMDSNIGPIGDRNQSLVYTPYIPTPAGALLRDPTEGACLSSGFGWRGTAEGGGSNHTGIDLANPNGGFIFAAAAGRVTFAGWRGSYGLTMIIDHGRGVQTLYGHLSEANPAMTPGAPVDAGAAIARMGATGNATGVHLHYEVIIDGLKVDPLNYGVAPPQTESPSPEMKPPPTDAPPTSDAPTDPDTPDKPAPDAATG
jgi:murein DD-endopeptidase MepM/ murein hydrolase activator NlpD